MFDAYRDAVIMCMLIMGHCQILFSSLKMPTARGSTFLSSLTGTFPPSQEEYACSSWTTIRREDIVDVAHGAASSSVVLYRCHVDATVLCEKWEVLQNHVSDDVVRHIRQLLNRLDETAFTLIETDQIVDLVAQGTKRDGVVLWFRRAHGATVEAMPWVSAKRFCNSIVERYVEGRIEQLLQPKSRPISREPRRAYVPRAFVALAVVSLLVAADSGGVSSNAESAMAADILAPAATELRCGSQAFQTPPMDVVCEICQPISSDFLSSPPVQHAGVGGGIDGLVSSRTRGSLAQTDQIQGAAVDGLVSSRTRASVAQQGGIQSGAGHSAAVGAVGTATSEAASKAGMRRRSFDLQDPPQFRSVGYGNRRTSFLVKYKRLECAEELIEPWRTLKLRSTIEMIQLVESAIAALPPWVAPVRQRRRRGNQPTRQYADTARAQHAHSARDVREERRRMQEAHSRSRPSEAAEGDASSLLYLVNGIGGAHLFDACRQFDHVVGDEDVSSEEVQEARASAAAEVAAHVEVSVETKAQLLRTFADEVSLVCRHSMA